MPDNFTHHNGGQGSCSRGSRAPQWTTTAPTFSPLQLGTIPQELVEWDQWINWRYAPQPNGKPKKFPVDSRTGGTASVSNPGTWGSFSGGVDGLGRDGVDGIGFVFSAADPFAGVDLDGCRNTESGSISPDAQEVIALLDSYTETSPSGDGLHVIANGTLPGAGRRNGMIELYDRGRFFTITGCHLDGTPRTIEQRNERLQQLYWRLAPISQAIARPPAPQATRGDLEVLKRARNAANRDKFDRLFRGDWTGYESASEADLALCGMLAYWTNNDEEQIDRLFRQSGLSRDKWDEPRDGGTYGQRTISKAMSNHGV